MRQDNHNFCKNESRIFFGDHLDTHHRLERADEMSVLARPKNDRKRSVHPNKDVMAGTGDRVAIAAGGGQHAALPEDRCRGMWYAALRRDRFRFDFSTIRTHLSLGDLQ
jgi:hypothetical protein